MENSETKWVEVPINAITRNLDERGITYELIDVPVTDSDGNKVKDENGNVVTHQAVHILEVPPDEQSAIDFIGGKKCWFAGCEELRKKYEEEYEEAGGAEGCTTCEKNKIMRKYIRLVREAIKADNKAKAHHEENSNGHPGTVAVSGPDEEGERGVGEKRSLLRRAASRFKKILRACTE